MLNSTEHEIFSAHHIKVPTIVGILTFISRINTIFNECLMPRLHLPWASYDLFVYDFPGIVGGYKLRHM